MAEFSIPVRKYSYYTTLESAPSGFVTGKPTSVDNWKHLSADGSIFLIFSNSSPNKLLMRVVMQPHLQNLEVIDFFELKNTFSGFDHDPFQFSAKAPSISCKYLIRKNDGIFMKRFQLGFHNGVDFVQATDIIQKLGFAVKPAVSKRSNTAITPSQAFFFNQNSMTGFLSELQLYPPNNQFYNQSQLQSQQWQNSQQQNFIQNTANMDFVLSQSTPLPAPRAPLFNDRIEAHASQQFPEPPIMNEPENQNHDIKNVDKTVVKPTMSVCNELKTDSSEMKENRVEPTLDLIKSKLANPEFMKLVCY
ncbi:unnamed protein product [Kluyveromyces dobzhanskii CBS 2104]|uniref:WGS project CCBQ000000000 data, contig 00107 n=1 Tax=Kluyveromyces dobzhanskii CBS 2104 TaxID=1427455 RepID=A0A0A8KYW7_9SACH|nr:unnamed protein product [Kluyveromyces dobzhanskii CBS 2104]